MVRSQKRSSKPGDAKRRTVTTIETHEVWVIRGLEDEPIVAACLAQRAGELPLDLPTKGPSRKEDKSEVDGSGKTHKG